MYTYIRIYSADAAHVRDFLIDKIVQLKYLLNTLAV